MKKRSEFYTTNVGKTTALQHIYTHRYKKTLYTRYIMTQNHNGTNQEADYLQVLYPIIRKLQTCSKTNLQIAFRTTNIFSEKFKVKKCNTGQEYMQWEV